MDGFERRDRRAGSHVRAAERMRRNARRAGIGSFLAILALVLPFAIAHVYQATMREPGIADLLLGFALSLGLATGCGLAAAFAVVAVTREVRRRR